MTKNEYRSSNRRTALPTHPRQEGRELLQLSIMTHTSPLVPRYSHTSGAADFTGSTNGRTQYTGPIHLCTSESTEVLTRSCPVEPEFK